MPEELLYGKLLPELRPTPPATPCRPRPLRRSKARETTLLPPPQSRQQESEDCLLRSRSSQTSTRWIRFWKPSSQRTRARRRKSSSSSASTLSSVRSSRSGRQRRRPGRGRSSAYARSYGCGYGVLASSERSFYSCGRLPRLLVGEAREMSTFFCRSDWETALIFSFCIFIPETGSSE
jgi:hypothetical protein